MAYPELRLLKLRHLMPLYHDSKVNQIKPLILVVDEQEIIGEILQ